MRLPNFVFSALLLCLICQPAAAQAGSKSAPKNDLAATRKAAEQGDAAAQFNLGLLYHLGQGVPQDDVQAAVWWRKAADQGDAAAQTILGFDYDLGHGVPQDDAQAAIWISKAAEQGDARAQTNLGVLYDLGHGVPQDDAEAYFWFDLAASGKVSGLKQEDVDNLRDDAAKHLTPAELSRVQERAKKWFEDHPPKKDTQ